MAIIVQDGLPLPARYHAMVVIILGIALSVLDGTIVNLALPGIGKDLQASAAQTIWVVNAYQIATLAVMLPCATLGDLVGYKRVYLIGLALFTVASLGCALSDSLAILAIARAIQGLGAAGIMSVNTALVRLIYPRHMLGRGVAINSLVVAASSVAGPSVAAGILSHASWHWLFALNLPLGIIVLWMGFRALPQNIAERPEGAMFSWFDVLLNVMMFSLVFFGADAMGARNGKASMSSLMTGSVLLVSGVVVGAIYVRRQMKQRVPLFPVDLLRIPVFALSMCTSVLAFSAQMLALISLPFLMLESYGRSPLQAGLLITAWPLAIVVVAPIVGRLIGRYPDGLLGGIGLSIMALGLGLLALLPSVPNNIDILWRIALCGIGLGLFQSPNNHTILTTAPEHRSGGASGMQSAARLTGQTLGAVILAIIFSFTTVHDGHGPVIAMEIGACLAAMAGTFSMLRLRHPN